MWRASRDRWKCIAWFGSFSGEVRSFHDLDSLVVVARHHLRLIRRRDVTVRRHYFKSLICFFTCRKLSTKHVSLALCIVHDMLISIANSRIGAFVDLKVLNISFLLEYKDSIRIRMHVTVNLCILEMQIMRCLME